LRIEVPDAAALGRAREFAAALARHGGVAPLALCLAPELAREAKDLAARWVIRVAPDAPPALLVEAARAALAGGVALEWRVSAGAGAASDARVPGLLAALDAVLEASSRSGLRHFLVSVESRRSVPAVRAVAARLRARGAAPPLVLAYAGDAAESPEDTLLHASMDLGSLLCDGIGDAVVLPAREDAGESLALAYRILQGARLRTTWTEFISCPSCGRTLFDLEETTARIQAQTKHLSGVKIAIMGCIVNGPGEMADADFGYVGSGPGLVNLYVGHECVERHVPQADADRRLVELIRRHGRWVDPSG
jgi:4-hydroxy-3-methylbut-2-en-1-yl diphosphate synthase IspG/GcpE